MENMYDQVAGGEGFPAEQPMTMPTFRDDIGEEDEDDMLNRYGSHVLGSQGSDRSSDHTGSKHSASNGRSGDEEEGALQDGANNGSSNSNDSNHPKKKLPHARIKDTIEGMRRADKDAQLQRSTRRFMAMSEGQRNPQTFTQAICLSPWCDFSHGRGMALMLGSLSLCVLMAVTLGYKGHLGWGLGTSISGLGIILVRRFWVPLYWLVWGQFAEKRRRRNMQQYDTLNGDSPGAVAMAELNDHSSQSGEMNCSNEEGIGDSALQDTAFALPPPPQFD